MRRDAPALWTHVVAGVACLLLTGCPGPKRKPLVTGGPPGAKAPAGSSSRPASEPVEAPDIRALDRDNAGGQDFGVSDASGEGGPLADVRFDFNSAQLSDEARGLIEKHALWLQNHRAARVTIEGHCDERGTAEYNLALGDKRAQATRDYLASLGVAPDRLRAISLGKERPLDPGHGEDAWAKNRRAHFAVSR